jgi:hypothetical protein
MWIFDDQNSASDSIIYKISGNTVLPHPGLIITAPHPDCDNHVATQRQATIHVIIFSDGVQINIFIHL